MATIQDIFDWLNQGAQGDIPGTGGSQPNAPQASQSAQPQVTPASASSPPSQQPAQPPSTITVDPDAMSNLDFRGIGNLLSQYHQIAQTAPGTDQYFDPQNPQTSVVTPSNYAGDIPAELLPHFQALVQGGLPPDVAKSILLQPSTGEGEKPPSDQWSSYSGWQQEARAAQQGDRTAALWNQMKDKIFNDALNLPTWEQDTPGDDDSLGFTRLPSGQYVPGWGG